MAILRYLSFIVLALGLTSCYEEFTPDIDTRPVLCLNSLITAGMPIEVAVTHTRLYTDKDADISVHDAELSVFANGRLCGPDYIAQEGDRIRIVAESRTYGHAEAEVDVPVAVSAETFNWTPVLNGIFKGEATPPEVSCSVSFNISAELTIADPPGRENYYAFSYFGFNKSYDGIYCEDGDSNYLYFSYGTFQYNAEPIFSEHIGIFESIMGEDFSGFTFFTDRQFEGGSYPLHLLYKDCQWLAELEQWDPECVDCGLTLTLHSISQSYYNYAIFLWHNDYGPLGDIGDLGLGNTLCGYSNVSTGAGVVAAQSYTDYTIDLKDFLLDALDKQ